MSLAYEWHPSIIFIKNAEFSFCFYILLFIWWWFGKVKDLYTDAQIVSHPWFLSTPYFRCHHTDVYLSLHLLLKKVTFRYLFFFLHVFGKMFYFPFVTIWVFIPLLGFVPTPLNRQSLYQSKVWWQQCGWSVICLLYSPTWAIFWHLSHLIYQLNIRLLCIASILMCDT